MRNIICILILLITPTLLCAQPPAVPPGINAEAAVLLDAATGRVLFEKNADEPIPPASMTKLMTIHTALKFINAGTAAADAAVPISAAADFRNLPPRSSLMFLEEGQHVSLFELLQGLALPSGNDAGIAVAEYLAGSVDNFVALMNQEAEQLGMIRTHFDDSSGLSEKNITTAREYAGFCRTYINENAAIIGSLHGPADFTYPKTYNLPSSGTSVHGPITQRNHNLLIGRMEGVDGLKTGYIDESGYNFAATAQRDGRRLILVLMGGPGNNSSDGSLKRVIDASALLTYGFYAWTEITPAAPENCFTPVSGGRQNSLRLQFSNASKMLIETSRIDDLEFVRHVDVITPPVAAGSIVGRWELILDNEVLQSGILTSAEAVERGNIFKRFFDNFLKKKN